MELFPYNGTWITCGAYAFLNSTNLDIRHLIEVENSAGATFGIATAGKQWDYTRLLTPVRDFNSGIDSASKIWGVEIVHKECDVLDDFIRNYFKSGASGYIIGPIRMDRLSYLPLFQQYYLADHYIALHVDSNNNIKITDSEGIIGLFVGEDELNRMISGKGIPESGGKIHVRAIFKVAEMLSAKERLLYTIKIANDNFIYANSIMQGPQSFLKCKDILSVTEVNRWKKSLEFDLNYIIQRRIMMQQLLKSAEEFCISDCITRINIVLNKQMQVTALCLDSLYQGDNSISNWFDILFELEAELTDRWKEWWIHDWN